jgi:5-methyltetrahydrofolate--homocysteine methyltransferase
MVMAIAKGLDGAIVNPLDKQMMASITAAEVLAGKDEY